MQKVYGDLQRLNKKALIASKFAGGSMGINVWNTFVLRVEHRYIVRRSEKSLDMGEATFHTKKTACYRLQQQNKVHVLALLQQTTLENSTETP